MRLNSSFDVIFQYLIGLIFVNNRKRTQSLKFPFLILPVTSLVPRAHAVFHPLITR